MAIQAENLRAALFEATAELGVAIGKLRKGYAATSNDAGKCSACVKKVKLILEEDGHPGTGLTAKLRNIANEERMLEAIQDAVKQSYAEDNKLVGALLRKYLDSFTKELKKKEPLFKDVLVKSKLTYFNPHART